MFQKGRLVRRRGIVGGAVSVRVGFEVSKAMAGPGLLLSACGSDWSSQLMLKCRACCRGPRNNDNKLTIRNFKLVPIKSFLL